MTRWSTVLLVVVAWLVSAQTASAQRTFDAQWIWYDTAGPNAQAPAGKAWFRREVPALEPSTGIVYIVCNDSFTLWVNGQKLGEGEGRKTYRFSLNGIVGARRNIVAVEADHKRGPAGLYVDGEIRTQSGHEFSVDTGPLWHTTRDAPQGDGWLKADFDDSAWKAPAVIGPHDASPWKNIVLQASEFDHLEAAPGFVIKRVAEPELVGSIICITWGNRNRLIASREGGPILSLIDEDGDGSYERAVEYSNQVEYCQGLCMVGDDLYAVGNGPNGTGLYRLPDRNGDDIADEVELIHQYVGSSIGEHGPHDVVFGPNGWLYNNIGNHTIPPVATEPETPLRDYYEGTVLLPKFEDASGHARGIKAPGGTIWRFTPDGKSWWCEMGGFRNEYDVAFDANGELFAFDADMEWDVGLPWYRPIRVNHCIPGAEFGWRSGLAKWPAFYFDSLDSVVDVGRGSPTGVVFYNHTQFPEKYRGAFITCDWSMGRILAVFLDPKGATFKGRFETLVAGNPLNVSDVEVAPDGSIVYSTGGRATEGGIYRLSYAQNQKQPAAHADTVEQLLDLPQMQSAWARDIARHVKATAGANWARTLDGVARNGTAEHKIRALTLLSQLGPKPGTETLIALCDDANPEVRQFAVWLLGDHSGEDVRKALERKLTDPDPKVKRRACEAFVRSGMEAPVESLLALLGQSDRWLRFAARLTLERVPVSKWKSQVLASNNPDVLTSGLLALYRRGNDALPPNDAMAIEWQLLDGKRGSLSRRQRLDVMRMVQLTHLAGADSPEAGKIGSLLMRDFPSGDVDMDRETSRLAAALQVPGATEKIMQALESTPSREQQIHYAMTLRYLNDGWTFDMKRRMLNWYEKTRVWEGGHSMQGYLANIIGAGLARYSPDDRRAFIAEWRQRPFAAGLLIGQSQPEEVAEFEKVIQDVLAEPKTPNEYAEKEELVFRAIDALGRSASRTTQPILRQLYERFPDRRDQLARTMAMRPDPESWPQLVHSLETGDSTTKQFCIQALKRIRKKPDGPEPYRAAILAALKLKGRAAAPALQLLELWTGSRPDPNSDAAQAVAHFQAWYGKKFPNAPPAQLPKSSGESKYTYEQLIGFLERSSAGREGDAERGKQVFVKAKCIKCHRLMGEGETIGPDLTTLRRRFQRKEIIESLLYPSQVISDQYRPVTVVTVNGLVHTGMPIPNPNPHDDLVLVLSDATKLQIPQSEIDETAPSKISIMPEGLLNDLTLSEIADMFAFLETSKYNPEQPARASAGGSGGN